MSLAQVFDSVRRVTENEEKEGRDASPISAALDLLWLHMSADEREQVTPET
jgi:hypothetical protein